jgi:hypothetical protein
MVQKKEFGLIWPVFEVLIFNSFSDEQKNFFGTVPKQVLALSKLSIFCLRCKRSAGEPASSSPADRLHPKHIIEI